MYEFKIVALLLCYLVFVDRANSASTDGRMENKTFATKLMFHWTTFSRKYLKRRFTYSSSHSGSFSSAVITNREGHMTFGNMENTSLKQCLKRKTPAKITDLYAKSDKRPTYSQPTAKLRYGIFTCHQQNDGLSWVLFTNFFVRLNKHSLTAKGNTKLNSNRYIHRF